MVKTRVHRRNHIFHKIHKNRTVITVRGTVKLANMYPGIVFKVIRNWLKSFSLLTTSKVICRSFLLTSLGTVVYEKLRTLVHPLKTTESTIDNIWSVLERYYSPKTHTLAQRYKFLKCTQQSGENINEFVVRIKNLAEKCKFGDYIPNDLSKTTSAELSKKALEDALRDKVIMGVSDAKIQQMLLEKKELTFERSVELAQNFELSKKDQESMSRSSYVNAISTRNGAQQSRGRSKSRSRVNHPKRNHS